MKKILYFSVILTILLFLPTSTYAAIHQGIDVSNWQGYINYSEVKNSGIEIVYIKASQGNSIIDSHFRTNYNNAKANGLKIGLYHFLTARSILEAEEQAQFFSSVISLMGLNITLSLKRFPTLFTRMVSFSIMDPFMILKRTEILKGFVTLFTGIGFLLCVNLFMLQKDLGRTKSHSTVFTFTWLLSVFFILMCFASSLTSEGHI